MIREDIKKELFEKQDKKYREMQVKIVPTVYGDSILPYIEEHRLDTWTHNKAIQKSVASYRITPEQKEYLKTLKIKR